MLAIPGALSLALLALAYLYSARAGFTPRLQSARGGLGGVALLGFASAALLAPWPVLSYYHAGSDPKAVAVFYAAAMAVDAGAAVASGVLVDRAGLRGLAAYPLLAAAATATLALPSSSSTLAIAALLWGAATGFLEAGFKAGVALLEGGSPRGYGVFGFSVGLGSAVAGLTLSRAMSSPLLVALYLVAVMAVLGLSLARTLRARAA